MPLTALKTLEDYKAAKKTTLAVLLAERGTDVIALALTSHIKLKDMQAYLDSPHALSEIDAADLFSIARALNLTCDDLDNLLFPNEQDGQ